MSKSKVRKDLKRRVKQTITEGSYFRSCVHKSGCFFRPLDRPCSKCISYRSTGICN